MSDTEEFGSFMKNEVAARFHDEEAATAFEADLRSLASTGFADSALNDILSAEIPEERDWAAGEALAEAYLTRRHNVTWPWNMERDKRTPKASLPGADLVGFENNGAGTRLVLGEVKTSSDANTPPGVMKGRSGMAHQIDQLGSNLSLITQLLKWLHPRCKNTAHEVSFNAAVSLLLNSENQAMALFGVLIRDVRPNPLDLENRGRSLANTVNDPTTCQLLAIYLPCSITDLPGRISGGSA